MFLSKVIRKITSCSVSNQMTEAVFSGVATWMEKLIVTEVLQLIPLIQTAAFKRREGNLLSLWRPHHSLLFWGGKQKVLLNWTLIYWITFPLASAYWQMSLTMHKFKWCRQFSPKISTSCFSHLPPWTRTKQRIFPQILGYAKCRDKAMITFNSIQTTLVINLKESGSEQLMC